jgi:hypothetical protein
MGSADFRFMGKGLIYSLAAALLHARISVGANRHFRNFLPYLFEKLLFVTVRYCDICS